MPYKCNEGAQDIALCALLKLLLVVAVYDFWEPSTLAVVIYLNLWALSSNCSVYLPNNTSDGVAEFITIQEASNKYKGFK